VDIGPKLTHASPMRRKPKSFKLVEQSTWAPNSRMQAQTQQT